MKPFPIFSSKMKSFPHYKGPDRENRDPHQLEPLKALLHLPRACSPSMAVSVAAEPHFHVLAVDDSLTDRKLIERLLKNSSYHVTAVDSVSKALEFLGLLDHEAAAPEVDVNLIITDYCMPGMTGYDLLKKIKESCFLKDIPVVIMSSENLPSRINRPTKGAFGTALARSNFGEKRAKRDAGRDLGRENPIFTGFVQQAGREAGWKLRKKPDPNGGARPDNAKQGKKLSPNTPRAIPQANSLNNKFLFSSYLGAVNLTWLITK